MHDALIMGILMYVVLPLWLAAGFADTLCHRAQHIEATSGVKESMLHLLLFAEMGVPMLAALLLDVNALVILVMIVCLVLHEATTLWDLAYATRTRSVGWVEQRIHGVLAMVPLMALTLILILHWGQFIALFGFGDEVARFEIRFKFEALPWPYVIAALAAALVFGVLPIVGELRRGLRARRLAIVTSAH